MTHLGLGIDFATSLSPSLAYLGSETPGLAIFSPNSGAPARQIAAGNRTDPRVRGSRDDGDAARAERRPGGSLRRPKSMVELRHQMTGLGDIPEQGADEEVEEEMRQSRKLRKTLSQDAVRPAAPTPRLDRLLPTLDARRPFDSPSNRRPDFRPRSLSEGSGLNRQATLLTRGGSSVNRSRELSRLLAPTAATHPPLLPPAPGEPAADVALEGSSASQKTRVELDVLLDSSVVVEGGELKGLMEARVAGRSSKNGDILMGLPKIRIVGFEELPSSNSRFIFFHHAAVIDRSTRPDGADSDLPCFDSPPDEEGYHRAVKGCHKFPFCVRLPLDKGAKGVWESKQGAIRYIVICSAKVKSSIRRDDAIAHFYREVEVYPYHSPGTLFAPSPGPVSQTATKGVFLGGRGKVHLTASVHRRQWVAGQRCYVAVRVKNEAGKRASRRLRSVKSLTLSLMRTTNIFRPEEIDLDSPVRGASGPGGDRCQSTKKKVAETVLAVGKKGGKGSVTARGLWMGVEKGEEVAFTHFVLLPPDALSITRGRHIEVNFTIRASIGISLSLSDVSVDLPIQIVNFVSLDPPPGHTTAAAAMSSYSGTPDDQSVNKHIEMLNAAAPAPRAEPMRQTRSDSSETLRAVAMQSSYARSRADALVQREPSSSSSYRSAESHATGPNRAAGYEPRRLQHQMSMDVLAAAIADRRLPRVPTGPRFPHASASDESDDDMDDDRYTTLEEQSVLDDAEDYYSPSVASVEIPGVGSGRVRPLPPSTDLAPAKAPSVTLARSSSGLHRAASGARLRAVPQPRQVVSSLPESLELNRSISASTYHVDAVQESFSRLYFDPPVAPAQSDEFDALTRLYRLRDAPDATPASTDSGDMSDRIAAPRVRPRSSRNALGHRVPSTSLGRQASHRLGETTDSAASTGDSLSPPELDTDSSAYSPASLEQALTPRSLPASGDSADLPSAGHFASWLPSPSSRSPASTKAGQSKSMVLPSVRSKVAAFESRQQALRTFASTEELVPRTAGLTRHDSILSEAPSAFVGAASLTRMDSVGSTHFRAPLLREQQRAGRHLR